MSSFTRCDRTPAWGALKGHFEAHGRNFDVREAFARDAGRFEAFGVEAPEVFADLSKNLIDTATRRFLLDLARECGVEARRDAMFAGAPINTTEGRAVLHTALRAPHASALGRSQPEVEQVLSSMLAYVETVRDTPASGIRHIVNIGIGGSDLGPQMVVPALDAFAHPGLTLHFVSNVDGHDITPVLRKLKAHETLFIVASKTFTTQETMAIGLPIALAIGADNFRALLDGAHAMDEHFAHTPAEKNLPLLLGLLDVWYRNFHGFTSRSVAPYHQGLKRLPAYLQQLEMESNGKRVDLAGEPLPYATSPVVWGEPGTNGQHAYFQMLHQGTDVIPVEFILVKHPTHGLSDLHGPLLEQLERQHIMLLANGLAQSQALMQGKSTEQAQREKAPTASKDLDALTLARHRTFPGNRPSTTFVLDQLTPRSLGALIALYEHRVFTSGALWGINSFDQWGVELGKALCNDLLPRLATGDVAGLDASTSGLMARLR
ncbi:MAG: glucose-6-phosphate isomerase [Burkholderiaceae bacterium]